LLRTEPSLIRRRTRQVLFPPIFPTFFRPSISFFPLSVRSFAHTHAHTFAYTRSFHARRLSPLFSHALSGKLRKIYAQRNFASASILYILLRVESVQKFALHLRQQRPTDLILVVVSVRQVTVIEQISMPRARSRHMTNRANSIIIIIIVEARERRIGWAPTRRFNYSLSLSLSLWIIPNLYWNIHNRTPYIKHFTYRDRLSIVKYTPVCLPVDKITVILYIVFSLAFFHISLSHSLSLSSRER